MTILAAAAAVRLLTGLPALEVAPFSDEIDFHGLAVRLATGQGYTTAEGRPTSWRPPLWPGVLAACYRVAGPSPSAGRELNIVLGTLLVALVMALAAAAKPADPRVPALAGWWAALSPTLVYYSHTLFSETLFGLCLGLALLALLRARDETGRGWPLLLGLALGLACLARGSTVLLVPPALVWLAGSDGRGRRHGTLQAVLAALLCAAVIAPWTARNYRVHGGLILVDSNGAVNFFYGNHPRTPRLRPWEVVELPHRPWPTLPAGSSEVELQRQALTEASLYVRARPAVFLRGLVIKTGNLWGLARGLPSGVAAGLYGRPTLPKLAAAAVLDGLDGLALLLLGLLGLGLAPVRAPVELQTVVMLYLTLVHATSYGHSRYRFGALLLLFGFAAQAALRARSWRADLAALPRGRRLVTLVLLVLVALNVLYEVVVLELLPRLA